eukprot:scaffold54253_cov77-Attheya_sp.AAC.3
MKKSESSVAERPRIITFSCCKLCHEHISAPRYVKVKRHYNVCTFTYAASNAFETNINVNTGEIRTACKTPPPFSITNGNCFGKAPESLEVLNEIEHGVVNTSQSEGLFTPAQKAQVMTRTTINRALDTSETEEGSDDPREHIYEVTAFFPDGSEVTQTSGGHPNANKFTLEYLQRNMNGANKTLLTSRPTREHASNFAEDFLVDSFPLQFPYGIGGPKSTRVTKVSYFDMLKYYLRVADWNFMQHDFILFVHSLWEKEKAMTTAFIHAPIKMSNGVAQRLGSLRPEDLIEEANIRVNQRNRENFVQTPAKIFFDTIESSCKAMAHTNQASKTACLSPCCDETNFRLRLYIGRAQYMLPGVDWSEEDCTGDYKMRCEQRTMFPDASAFDFSAIFNIVISDILGWDEENRCSFSYGGAFGVIDAFSGAVEEQGRKHYMHICLYSSMIFPDCC